MAVFSDIESGVFLCFLASALGLQIGMIVVVLLLLGLGAALFTYFYRRR